MYLLQSLVAMECLCQSIVICIVNLNNIKCERLNSLTTRPTVTQKNPVVCLWYQFPLWDQFTYIKIILSWQVNSEPCNNCGPLCNCMPCRLPVAMSKKISLLSYKHSLKLNWRTFQGGDCHFDLPDRRKHVWTHTWLLIQPRERVFIPWHSDL